MIERNGNCVRNMLKGETVDFFNVLSRSAEFDSRPPCSHRITNYVDYSEI